MTSLRRFLADTTYFITYGLFEVPRIQVHHGLKS